MSLHAYIDESMRQRKDDDCVYVLAAALVDDRYADEVRDALKSLRYRKNPTIHWREEQSARQLEVVRALLTMPATGLIATRLYEHQRGEGARRRCMRALFAALAARDVHEVAISSRCPSRDRDDAAFLSAVRREWAPHRIATSWAQYETEPLLWAADVFAGTVTWSFSTEDRYADTLDPILGYLDA
jgi:hypothetical protein